MPSRERLAIRQTEAHDRLNRGLRRLSKRLGIEPSEVGSRIKDKELAAVVVTEQMADAVDAMDARIKEMMADAAPAESSDDETVPADVLAARTKDAANKANAAISTDTAPDAPGSPRSARKPRKES